jgi:hypothetical protein
VPVETATQIAEFWSWWQGGGEAAVVAAVRRNDRTAVNDLLAKRSRVIDTGLEFDIRRGYGAEFRLSLSGRNVPAARVVAERWLRAAPAADGVWEYAAARPRDRKALERIHRSGPHGVGAGQVKAQWTWDEDTAKLSVTLVHRKFQRTPPTPRDRFARAIVAGVIGEDEAARWVGSYETSAAVDDPRPLPEFAAAVDALEARRPLPEQWRQRDYTVAGRPGIARVLVAPHWLDLPLFDMLSRIEFRNAAGDRAAAAAQLEVPPGELWMPEADEVADALVPVDELLAELRSMVGDRGIVTAELTQLDRSTLFLYTDHVDEALAAWIESWAHARGCSQFRQVRNAGWTSTQGLAAGAADDDVDSLIDLAVADDTGSD